MKVQLIVNNDIKEELEYEEFLKKSDSSFGSLTSDDIIIVKGKKENIHSIALTKNYILCYVYTK